MTCLVGYARVSSADQGLELQLEALTKAGCERVFSEKLSGASAKNRPELQACIASLSKGDVLVVTRLDRLARSAADLWRILSELTEREVGFQCLNQPAVDTTTAMGRFMLSILGAVAELERDMIKERQKEGVARAKVKGVYKGRPPRPLDLSAVQMMRGEGRTPDQIAAQLGVSRRTVYRRAPCSP